MKKSKYIIILLLVSIIIAVVTIGYNVRLSEIEEIKYIEFLELLEDGKVEYIDIVSQDYIEIQLKDSSKYRAPNPQSNNMKEYFLLHGATIKNSGSTSNVILQALSLLAIAAVGYAVIKKGVAKDKIQVIDANDSNAGSETVYTFKSVAGNDEAKEMVKDIIEFIKKPEKFAKLGAKMPRGIMLYGPPGTGKTLMAKAVAGEAGVPFYAVSGSDFVQMYVGVGASRVRQLFKKAKKSEKAVIFIDEIDAIGKKRCNGVTQANDERDQTLNALLTELSGFDDNEGIVVLAATNRLDSLDDALLRPGRFDRLIEIGLPDVNARRKILELHMENKPVDISVNLDKLARETVYFSGAMLENLTNEAAILAAKENLCEITQRQLDKAYYNTIAGSEKKDRSYISTKDVKITAYHESGHALVSKLVLPYNIISKITIIPSTRGFGGFSMSIPKDSMYKTKKQIIGDIKVMLAGRAAEELIFGEEEITTGATNDIEKASKLIKDYIIKFGMDDDFGMFNLDAVNMNSSSIVIDRCREQINLLYENTKQLISDNKYILDTLADELMRKETLNEEEISDLFSDKLIA